jgi:hypothetical protein
VESSEAHAQIVHVLEDCRTELAAIRVAATGVKQDIGGLRTVIQAAVEGLERDVAVLRTLLSDEDEQTGRTSEEGA